MWGALQAKGIDYGTALAVKQEGSPHFAFLCRGGVGHATWRAKVLRELGDEAASKLLRPPLPPREATAIQIQIQRTGSERTPPATGTDGNADKDVKTMADHVEADVDAEVATPTAMPSTPAQGSATPSAADVDADMYSPTTVPNASAAEGEVSHMPYEGPQLGHTSTEAPTEAAMVAPTAVATDAPISADLLPANAADVTWQPDSGTVTPDSILSDLRGLSHDEQPGGLDGQPGSFEIEAPEAALEAAHCDLSNSGTNAETKDLSGPDSAAAAAAGTGTQAGTAAAEAAAAASARPDPEDGNAVEAGVRRVAPAVRARFSLATPSRRGAASCASRKASTSLTAQSAAVAAAFEDDSSEGEGHEERPRSGSSAEATATTAAANGHLIGVGADDASPKAMAGEQQSERSRADDHSRAATAAAAAASVRSRATIAANPQLARRVMGPHLPKRPSPATFTPPASPADLAHADSAHADSATLGTSVRPVDAAVTDTGSNGSSGGNVEAQPSAADSEAARRKARRLL